MSAANLVMETRVDWPFWAGLANGEIKIQRCNHCSNWIWPAEYRCCECGSMELHWENIKGEGVVYSWIRTHYPFAPGYEELIPYINLWIELPEAGNQRIYGLLLDDVESVSIGDKVTAVIEPPAARTRNLPTLCWKLSATNVENN